VGLLDDLEKEANKLKANAGDAERLKADRLDIYKTRLDPGISALYDYLGKMIGSLKILQPKKQLRLPIPGYGEIIGYLDHDYELKQTAQPETKEIRFSVNCTIASDECPQVEVLTSSKVRAVSGAFQRLHLGGLASPKKDVSGEIISATFRAKGKITLVALCNIDSENPVARFSFTNFDQFGTVSKNVAADQLNETFFDEIGRFLTLEPNTLFREALSDAYRHQLRNKVQQEEIKRRWESKIAAQQSDELAKMRRDQSLGGKFGKLVGQAAPKDKPADAPPDKPWLSSALDKLRGMVKKDK
jgi:hypothetical protein